MCHNYHIVEGCMWRQRGMWCWGDCRIQLSVISCTLISAFLFTVVKIREVHIRMIIISRLQEKIRRDGLIIKCRVDIHGTAISQGLNILANTWAFVHCTSTQRKNDVCVYMSDVHCHVCKWSILVVNSFYRRTECQMCVLVSTTFTPLFTTPSSFKSNGTCPLEALHPGTEHAGPQQQYRYSSTLSLTSALHGGEWSTPCPGHFTPGNEICSHNSISGILFQAPTCKPVCLQEHKLCILIKQLIKLYI